MKKFILMLSVAVFLGGCADTTSPTVYQRGSTQERQRVYIGRVIALTPVTIRGEEHPLVSAAGTVVGAVAGAHIGKGSGRVVGGVVGATLGGMAAQQAGRHIGGERGMEIVVQLDGGNEVISVVQADTVPLNIGQTVRVVVGGNTDRVLPMY